MVRFADRLTLIIYLTLEAGITWGFTIAIICLDFTGKFAACTTTARISGMSWRESSTVGSLMTCKGSALNFLDRIWSLTVS